MPNDAKLQKKHPKMAETLGKPTTLTRGLRTPQKEKLADPFSLPRIPEEEEFSEARDVMWRTGFVNIIITRLKRLGLKNQGIFFFFLKPQRI